MKKLLFLLILFPFVLNSCGSDDDDNYSNSDIVGTWVLQSKVAKEVKTNNEKATKAIKDDIEDISDEYEIFNFTSDGKVIINDDEEAYSGTYSLRGNKLTIDIDGDKNTTNITISGNTFSSDIDETEGYQDDIHYLVPNEKNVTVSKVIVTYTYKRK